MNVIIGVLAVAGFVACIWGLACLVSWVIEMGQAIRRFDDRIDMVKEDIRRIWAKLDEEEDDDE